MTKADLIRLVERLPDEAVEEAARRLEDLVPEAPPEDDWRSLYGIYKGEPLTRLLEEDRAREREAEERKIRR
jgi:hypothetical protein